MSPRGALIRLSLRAARYWEATITDFDCLNSTLQHRIVSQESRALMESTVGVPEIMDDLIGPSIPPANET